MFVCHFTTARKHRQQTENKPKNKQLCYICLYSVWCFVNFTCLLVSKHLSCFYFMLGRKEKLVLLLIPTLLGPRSFDPEAWLRSISVEPISFCYLFFFSLQGDQRNVFSFFASFGSDQQQVLCGSLGDTGGLWSLFAAWVH